MISIVARANSERELGDALRAKARTNFRHAEFELAAQTYRLAIEVSPGYAGLGASQLALGDAHGAISSYKEAIRRAPGSSGFHAALGRAYLMTTTERAPWPNAANRRAQPVERRRRKGARKAHALSFALGVCVTALDARDPPE